MKSILTIQHQNKSRTISIFLVCISSVLCCMAQQPALVDSIKFGVKSLSLYENEIGYTPKAPDIIQPSPVSQSFTRYANFTPNLSTGTLCVPIPLYDFKAGNVTLPILLQYATNGIKVYDTPMPVGHGWSLQPAFRITRVVQGRMDDCFTRYSGYPNTEPEGLNLFLERIAGHHSFTSGELLDSQYDVFTVHLPHESFNFIIDWDDASQKYLASTVGVSAKINIVGKKNAGITYIQITDEDNIVYTYGSSSGNSPIEETDAGETTTWGLSQITLPGKQGYLKFHWSKNIYYGLSPLYNEYYYFKDAMYNGQSAELTGKLSASSGAAKALDENRQQYTACIKLDKIEYFVNQTEGSINDKLVSEISYTYSKFLTWDFINKIVVKDCISNRAIKEINFVVDSSTYLLNYIKVSGEGYYFFTYNQHISRNPGLTTGRDYWGFYNGKVAKYPQVPKTYVKSKTNYSSFDFYIGEGDMEPDEEYAQTNLLANVEYPTGGYSEFKYEIHQFDGIEQKIFGNIIPAFTRGGGVRIKEIKNVSGNDQKTIVKRYTYGKNEDGKGYAVAEPTRGTFFDIEAVHGYTMSQDGADLIAYHNDCRLIKLKGFSSYTDHLILGQPIIWYDEVNEYINNDIKTTYKYKHDPYTKWWQNIASSMTAAYNWRGVWTEPTFVKQVPYVLKTSTSPLLTEQLIYNCEKSPQEPYNYNLIQKRTYEYDHELIRRKEVKVYMDIIELGEDRLGQFMYHNGEVFFSAYKGFACTSPLYYHLPDNNVYSYIDWWLELANTYLREEKVFHYDTSVIEQINYKYGIGYGYNISPTFIAGHKLYQVLKEKIISNNASGTFKEAYLYPWEDISELTSGQQMGAYAMILQGNMTKTPVRLQQYKDSLLTAQKIIQYKKYNVGNGYILPELEYYKVGLNKEEPRIEYNNYDQYGNPLCITMDGAFSTVYLWGYNGRYPIAEIKNATYEEVETAAKAVFGVNSINGLSEKTFIDSDYNTLITKFKALREHDSLKEALVTGYTYRAMVGLTSITDPTGKTITYEYDGNNQLSLIRDNEGNIIEKYEYNYINRF